MIKRAHVTLDGEHKETQETIESQQQENIICWIAGKEFKYRVLVHIGDQTFDKFNALFLNRNIIIFDETLVTLNFWKEVYMGMSWSMSCYTWPRTISINFFCNYYILYYYTVFMADVKGLIDRLHGLFVLLKYNLSHTI